MVTPIKSDNAGKYALNGKYGGKEGSQIFIKILNGMESSSLELLRKF